MSEPGDRAEREMEFDVEDPEDRELLERLAQQIGDVLESVVEQTEDLDIDEATAVLQERLSHVEEAEFDTTWCKEVLEALRRGDDVEIELGG